MELPEFIDLSEFKEKKRLSNPDKIGTIILRLGDQVFKPAHVINAAKKFDIIHGASDDAYKYAVTTQLRRMKEAGKVEKLPNGQYRLLGC